MDSLKRSEFEFRGFKRRYTLVNGYYAGSDSSSNESDDDDRPWIKPVNEYNPDYLNVIKCLKFIQTGASQEICMLGLSFLEGCDLENESSIDAIVKRNGLETLVNLVEANHLKCRISALQILKKLTIHNSVTLAVMHLGLPSLLVDRLVDYLVETRILACDVIANVAHNRVASRVIRKRQGIARLVSQLQVSQAALLLNDSQLTEEERMTFTLTSSAGNALWKLAKFKKNRTAMLQTGIVSHMIEVILSGKPELSIPMTGVLSRCSSEPMVELAFENEEVIGILITDMLEHYDVNNKLLCAHVLSNAAGCSEKVRDYIRERRGLEIALHLLQNATGHEANYIEMLLTFIWKTAISPENTEAYEAISAHKEVASWLAYDDVRVQSAAAGAVGELAKRSSCRSSMIKLHVVTAIAKTLVSCHSQLLINGAFALGMLVEDPKALKELKELNGVSLLWTMLKNPDSAVRNQALWALKPCLRGDPDSGERTRSITGAMDLLITMLHTRDVRTLAAACSVVAQVARDLENLGVMTEKGVVKSLAQLLRREAWRQQGDSSQSFASSAKNGTKNGSYRRTSSTFSLPQSTTRPRLNLSKEDAVNYESEELRREVSSAISTCCAYKENSAEFGRLGVILPLTTFLDSRCADTRTYAALALWKLSSNSLNCVYLHSCNALPALLKSLSSDNQLEQVSVAGCIKNMRQNLITADITKMCAGDHVRRKKDPMTMLGRVSLA